MSDVIARRPDTSPGSYRWLPSADARAQRRPAAAVIAAVLAFEAAVVHLVGTLLVVLLLPARGVPTGAGARLLLLGPLLADCVLAGLILAGGLAVIRGTGRTLLLVTSAIEAALLVALGLITVLNWPTAGKLPAVAGAEDAAHAIALVSTVVYGLVLAALALRVWFAATPSVGRWLRAERTVRTSSGTWAGAAPRQVRDGGRGALIAVLLPVVPLAVAAVLVVLTGPTAAPATGGSATPRAYRGTSDWGTKFYQGGAPLTPPSAGGTLYSAASDSDAYACYRGAMAACDDLFRTAPVGDVYEWYGSSCAGRLDHESDGGCVATLGEIAK